MGSTAGCARCGEPPATGALCRDCAAAIAPIDVLIPDHVASRTARGDAAGWLVDGFGVAHPIGPRATVGRRPQADVVILEHSVSRDHAELVRVDDGWVVRDLGSRNRTHVDGRRVDGRAALPDRAIVRFGEVALLFVGRPLPLGDPAGRSIETAHAAATAAFRFSLTGPARELCLIGSDEGAGGALLHRATGEAAWTELALPPLEFQLLRALCVRAVAEDGSPSRARGCVPTKQLARTLPFQSRYANEENVRQAVRRLRGTLDAIGVADLIEAAPGRGYFVAWPVRAT